MVSHRSRPEHRREIERGPDGAGYAVPHHKLESFGMQVDHFVQRPNEKSHNNAGVLLPDGGRPRPELRLQFLRSADTLVQLLRTNGFQADAHVFAEEFSDLLTVRLGEQSGSQIGRADRIRLIYTRPLRTSKREAAMPNVNASMNARSASVAATISPTGGLSSSSEPRRRN